MGDLDREGGTKCTYCGIDMHLATVEIIQSLDAHEPCALHFGMLA